MLLFEKHTLYQYVCLCVCVCVCLKWTIFFISRKSTISLNLLLFCTLYNYTIYIDIRYRHLEIINTSHFFVFFLFLFLGWVLFGFIFILFLLNFQNRLLLFEDYYWDLVNVRRFSFIFHVLWSDKRSHLYICYHTVIRQQCNTF